MTSDEFPKSLRGRFFEFVKFAGGLLTIIGLFSAIWAVRTGPIASFFEAFERLTVAVEDQATFNREFDTRLDQLEGANDVLRVDIAYIEEPVYQNDEVLILTIIAQRTPLGQDCTLMTSQAFFRDLTGVLFVGELQIPTRQLAGAAGPTQLRSERVLPPGVRPGPITTSLRLKYQCGEADTEFFETVFAEPFLLLAGGNPNGDRRATGVQ